MSEEKALTQLDLQIAEGKIQLWLSLATVVAIVLALIPGFPAISAAMVPSAIVSCRGCVVSWRRHRARRRARRS